MERDKERLKHWRLVEWFFQEGESSASRGRFKSCISERL